MARKTVYLPDALMERLNASQHLSRSLSREFQDYLRHRLDQVEAQSWRGPSTSSANVRSLDADDVARVLELWDENGDEDGWYLSPMSQRRVADNLRRTVDHPDVFCLVALVDDEVVGFLTASISGHPVMPGKSGELEEITVARAHRRKGIGSDLVRTAMAWFDSAGISRVLCVYQSDDRYLKAFFEKLGFECDQSVANLWPR